MMITETTKEALEKLFLAAETILETLDGVQEAPSSVDPQRAGEALEALEAALWDDQIQTMRMAE